MGLISYDSRKIHHKQAYRQASYKAGYDSYLWTNDTRLRSKEAHRQDCERRRTHGALRTRKALSAPLFVRLLEDAEGLLERLNIMGNCRSSEEYG